MPLLQIPKGLALAGMLLLAAPLAAQTTAAQTTDTLDELATREAESLHAEASRLFQELLEQAGDFGGYGGGAWEESEHLQPTATQLRESMREALAATFSHADVESFWSSATGGRLLWLRSESAAGGRGIARSVRYVVDRLPAERLELVQSIDRATAETQGSVDVGQALLQLMHNMADRISSVAPDEAEWSESPQEIQAFLSGQFRDERFREFAYLTSRLEDVELREILDFAGTDPGRAYFEARHAARLAGAAAIVAAMQPRLDARLDQELREYEREEGEREDEGDEEDGP